jgi:hypothetical protein
MNEFEKRLSEENWVMPCDDEEQAQKFSKEIEQLGIRYGSSWSPTRLDRFKTAVEYTFAQSFSEEHKINWDLSRGLNGEHVLQITIRTKDLGQISTDIPVDFIHSEKCPKDLPEQLVKNFEEKFENKRERLIREWTKRKKSP